MKRLATIALILHYSLFILHSSPAAEVVVYSQPSASPVHVAVMSTNDVATSPARTFPASYTGHRAVCDMPKASTNDTFCAWIGGDSFKPGDLFGCSTCYDYPVIGLTKTCSILPRINLWSESDFDRDRVIKVGDNTNKYVTTFSLGTPETPKVRVRIIRYQYDDFRPFNVGTRVARIMLDKMFDRNVNPIISEREILSDYEFDIDWNDLYEDTYDSRGFEFAGGSATNINYLIVFGDGPVDYETVTSTNNSSKAYPILISRRYERYKTPPTSICEIPTTKPTFVWTIRGEDPWASEFGTTYTAFKIKLWDGTSTNGTPSHVTGYLRMPPADENGNFRYTWKSNLSSGTTYTWQVFTFNSKFKYETFDESGIFYQENTGSAPRTFTTGE